MELGLRGWQYQHPGKSDEYLRKRRDVLGDPYGREFAWHKRDNHDRIHRSRIYGTGCFIHANRPTSGTAPLTVQFTDQSTGSPTSWEWSFGDGSTSSLQNPSETYQNAGTYTVTLTSSNSEGSSTNTASQTISVDLWSGHNRSHYGVHDGPHLCGRR